jgi:hypothetical protein
MSSVFGTLTWSFHFLKYLSRRAIVVLSLREMVSVLQDRYFLGISSAYNAGLILGGGISAM